MARETRTAEELLQMSPVDQQADFEDSIVRNLDEVPRELLERVRAKVSARSAEAGSQKSR